MWTGVLILSIFCASSAELGVLILARGGSKGVHLKNLQQVGGVSLLRRAIRTARDAGFNDVTVSTDHPLIALEALQDKVTVLHRSGITATDWAPSIWGAAEYLAHRPDVTVLVLLQATSPFTNPSQLRSAVTKIEHPVPFDCVFSVTRSFKLRWKAINGRYHPVNFKLDRRTRRQDWNGDLLETGAFYISRRWIIEDGYFQNYKYAYRCKKTDLKRFKPNVAVLNPKYPVLTGLKLAYKIDLNCVCVCV